MDFKRLETESDYQEMLEEMSRLWGSEPGTPEGDRLDLIGVIIGTYESEFYPIDLSNS